MITQIRFVNFKSFENLTGLTLAAATGATTAELMHRAGDASADAALRYQHATQDRDRILAEALEKLVNPDSRIEYKYMAI